MTDEKVALLRAVEPPLGLYFRPGHSDHRALANILAAGASKMSGVVVDASLVRRQSDLRSDLEHLWVRMHPINKSSGASVLSGCLDICAELAEANLPLVAERAGFLGLCLLGFNAVGGVETGLTIGEGFDVGCESVLRTEGHKESLRLSAALLPVAGGYDQGSEAAFRLQSRCSGRAFGSNPCSPEARPLAGRDSASLGRRCICCAGGCQTFRAAPARAWRVARHAGEAN